MQTDARTGGGIEKEQQGKRRQKRRYAVALPAEERGGEKEELHDRRACHRRRKAGHCRKEQQHRQTHRDRPRPPPDQQKEKAHEKGDVHAGHRHDVREPRVGKGVVMRAVVVKVGLVAGEERREKRLHIRRKHASADLPDGAAERLRRIKKRKVPASGDLRRAGRRGTKEDALRGVGIHALPVALARREQLYRDGKLVARRERGEIFRIVGGDAALHARQVRVSDTHRYVFARIVNVRVVRHAHGDHTLFPGERVRGRGEKMLLHEKGKKPDRRAEQREMRAGPALSARKQQRKRGKKRADARRRKQNALRQEIKGYENGKGQRPAEPTPLYAWPFFSSVRPSR